MICVVDEHGNCLNRHKGQQHLGRLLFWATSDTPQGEAYRQLWDQQRAPDKPRIALGVRQH